jgi:hypothetical protein
MVGAVVRRFWRRTSLPLAPEDVEDLTAHLLLEMLVISRRFDPERDKKGEAGFVSYCSRLLDGRAVDWVRKRYLDTRYATEAERHAFNNALSLDAPADSGGDPLGETLEGSSGDFEAGCDPDLARILAERDRARAEDLAIIRALAA